MPLSLRIRETVYSYMLTQLCNKVSWADLKGCILGQREQKIRILHEYINDYFSNGYWVLPQQVVEWIFFQVAQVATSENAIWIQIYHVIIAYCIGHCAEKINVECSIYKILRIVSVSLIDVTNMKAHFPRTNYKLNGYIEPTLF